MKIRRANQSLVLILTAIVAISLLYSSTAGDGVIEDIVTIGPWTLVEPIGGGHPPLEVYTSRRIIASCSDSICP
jgi:hypothetical protein